MSVFPPIPEVPFLNERELAELSPEELQAYDHQLQYTQAMRSPLDLACWISPQTERTPHLEAINETIVALHEYRLYPSGPGPLPRWKYRATRDPKAAQLPGVRRASRNTWATDEEAYNDYEVTSVHEIPFTDNRLVSFYGENPVTGERVVFNAGIALPPRHGKSWIVTDHLPLWLWIRNPEHKIGFSTYSDDFAGFWGGRLRTRLVEAEDKLGISLRAGERQDRHHLQFKEIDGEMYLVGTGGSLTGKGLCTGICDDPFKDQTEAMSATIRNTKADWFESVFLARGEYTPEFPVPVYILMFTRWHEDDLAGRFVYGDDKKPRKDWYMLRLPALALEDDPLGRRPGQALWPRAKTRDQLLKIQARNPMWFGALYQGWPTTGKRGVFSRWHFYRVVDGRYVWDEDGETKSVQVDDCFRFATVDTAYTKNTWSDFSVFLVMDYSTEHARGFIRHVQREKIEGPDLPNWLAAQAARWNPKFIGVEDVSSGKQLLQELRRDNKGMTLRALPAEKDKVARAYPYAFQTVGGVYLLPAESEWVNEFTEEHSLFPGAGKHDDQVDAGSYAHIVAKDLPKYRKPPAEEAENADTRAARHIERTRNATDRRLRRSRSVLRGRL